FQSLHSFPTRRSSDLRPKFKTREVFMTTLLFYTKYLTKIFKRITRKIKFITSNQKCIDDLIRGRGLKPRNQSSSLNSRKVELITIMSNNNVSSIQSSNQEREDVFLTSELSVIVVHLRRV